MIIAGATVNPMGSLMTDSRTGESVGTATAGTTAAGTTAGAAAAGTTTRVAVGRNGSKLRIAAALGLTPRTGPRTWATAAEAPATETTTAKALNFEERFMANSPTMYPGHTHMGDTLAHSPTARG